MGVVIESEVWEPNRSVYAILFISCVVSILCLPTKAVANVLDHAPLASFLRFQRKFLLLFAISSGNCVHCSHGFWIQFLCFYFLLIIFCSWKVMEGLWAVFGEYESAYYGFSKEQMLTFLSVGYAASLFIGSFLGMLSDLM